MKKIISTVLAVLILLSAMPIISFMAVSADAPTETITLTPTDFSLTYRNNCSVDGNIVSSIYTGSAGTDQYPQFYIDLPGQYHASSVKITATFTKIDEEEYASPLGYRPGTSVQLQENSTAIYTSSTWARVFKEGEVSNQYTMNISAANQERLLDRIYMGGDWNNVAPKTAGAFQLTIESVEIIGELVSQNFTLTGNSFNLSKALNCNVDGNSVISVAGNKYPRFYIDLPSSYYAETIKVTATVNQNSGGFGVRLSNDTSKLVLKNNTEDVQTFDTGGSYTPVFPTAATTTYTMTVNEANRNTPIDRLYFQATWSTSNTPTADDVVLTINKIEIKGLQMGVSAAKVNHTTGYTLSGAQGVSENTMTTAAQSPQPKFTLNTPVYGNRVSVKVSNGNGTALQFTGINLTFSDGTAANTTALQGTNILANSTGCVVFAIPEEYKDKKLSAFKLAGYYYPAPASSYMLTFEDVTIYNVPTAEITTIIDNLKTPVYCVAGQTAYEALSNIKKATVALYSDMQVKDYAPELTGATVIDDENSEYNGCVLATAEVPFISSGEVSEEYYISEIGVVYAPTSSLGGASLLLDTVGANKVCMLFEDDADLSTYASFRAPICNVPGSAAKNITVRAYVIYTDGINTAAFYSENDDLENEVADGIATATLPAAPDDIVIIGDVNEDGEINILDLVCLKKYIANNEYSINENAANCNGDNAVDSEDLTALINYLIGADELAQSPEGFTLLGTWNGLVNDSPDFVDPV